MPLNISGYFSRFVLLIFGILLVTKSYANNNYSIDKRIKNIRVYDSLNFEHETGKLLIESKEKENFEGLSEVYFLIRKYHKYKRNPFLVLKYGKLSLNAAKLTKNKELINLRKIEILFDDPNHSLELQEKILLRLLNEAIKKKWLNSQIIGYANLSRIQMMNYQFNEAIISCNKGIQIAEKNNRSQFKSLLYNSKGSLNFQNRNFKEALKAFLIASKLYKKEGDYIGLGMIYNNLANVEGMLGNSKLQEYYYFKSLNCSKITYDNEGLSYTYYNLASFYFTIKNNPQKVTYFSDKVLADKQLNSMLRDKCLSLKIQVAINQNDDKTIQYCLSQLNMKNLDLETQSDILISQSKYEERKNNTSQSLNYLKEYVTIYDSLNKLNQLKSNKLINEINEKNKLELQLEKRKNNEQKINSKLKVSRLITAIIIVLTLIVIFVTILFYKLRYSKKINEQSRDFSIQLISNIEEERARIAMELHDGINQQLAMTKTKLELYQLGKIDSINSLHLDVKNIIDETRLICHKMFPSQLVEKELESAVRALINKIKELNSLQIVFEMNCSVENLSFEKQTHIFRIIQECINNTIKYAKANSIFIQLNKVENTYELRYTDDGIGIENKFTEHKGIGMSTINQRVQILKGKMEVVTSKDNGFNLIIYIND